MRAFILLAACIACVATARGVAAEDPRRAATAQVDESMAYHIGALAYLYGYTAVDLLQQRYKETHRITATQQVSAPVNRLFRFRELLTPTTVGSLRAPNADTLYLSGWFDLRQEPIVIRAPDTAGRYYTLAITDFDGEVQHVGRRTTGTAARDFVLIGPSFSGEVPAGLTPVRVATHDAWVLGRVLVRGAADLPAARAVVDGFETLPLAAWRRGVPAGRSADAELAVPNAAPWTPLTSLDFFATLNRWLREQPRRREDAGLLAQFDAAGFGPGVTFDESRLSEGARRGLLHAIEDGRATLRAASLRPIADVRNGWFFPLTLGRYGDDHLMRAAVAFGGYANLPEETVYAALTADARGELLRGERVYRLRFPAGARPPVAAFWSLSAYRLADFNFMSNDAAIYSVGDHKPEFRTAPDGSFVIRVSREPPTAVERAAGENWLPVGEGPFSLILRLYEPGRAVLDRSYQPPALEIVTPETVTP